MQAPRPIQSGELIGPWLNRLLAYVRSAVRVHAGPGIEVRQTEEGMVISTVPEVHRRIPATLYGGPSPDTPLNPSAVLYRARPMPPWGDTQGIAARVPDYGRPVRGDAVKVWPHADGTPCTIVRRPHPQTPGAVLVELEVPAERINFGPCPPAAAPPEAPGGTPLPAAAIGLPPADEGECGCLLRGWPESLIPKS